jgi:hypothetical protein
VFDRFHRAESARALPGSGLGLSIVRDVARIATAGGRVRRSATRPAAPAWGSRSPHAAAPRSEHRRALTELSTGSASLLTVDRHREGHDEPGKARPDEPHPLTPLRPPHPAAGPRRRGTILGVGAGVLGGGLVGLAMTVPTFITPRATTPPARPSRRPGRHRLPRPSVVATGVARAGSRLRGALQELVDDGTLTAVQADAVAEHLAAQGTRAHRGDRGLGGHRGPGMDGEVVAELLGDRGRELRTALRDGQSIADARRRERRRRPDGDRCARRRGRRATSTSPSRTAASPRTRPPTSSSTSPSASPPASTASGPPGG